MRRLLIFPIPYLMFPFLVLMVILVGPFWGTIPTYYKARNHGYDVTEHSLLGWVLNDIKIKLTVLFHQLKQWPRLWGRRL